MELGGRYLQLPRAKAPPNTLSNVEVHSCTTHILAHQKPTQDCDISTLIVAQMQSAL
jgi:hypothetical protein